MSQESRTSLSPIAEEASRSGRRRLFLGLVVGFGGVVLSLFFAWSLLSRERQLATMEFQDDAASCVEAIEHTMVNRVGAVRTLAAFYAGSNLVERVEFNTFTEALLEKHRGIEVLGWAPRVQTVERRRYERAVRRRGFPAVRDHRAGRAWTIGSRRHPRRVLPGPLRRTVCREQVTDSGSIFVPIPTCRAAIEKATATGQPAAWIRAATGAKGDLLLCVVMPARNRHADAASRPGDQPAGSGFVFGVFRIGPIIQGVLDLFPEVGSIEVSIVAPSEAGGERPLVMRLSPQHAPNAAAKPRGALRGGHGLLARHYESPMATGRSVAVPLESHVAQQRTWGPAAVLLGGLLLTGLLVGYLLLLSGRTAQVEQLVAERTRELRESEQRFRRLVDNAGDAFFLRDEQGKILDVNKRACDSLGYTREELLSMTIADIDVRFVPENLNQYAQLAGRGVSGDFRGDCSAARTARRSPSRSAWLRWRSAGGGCCSPWCATSPNASGRRKNCAGSNGCCGRCSISTNGTGNWWPTKSTTAWPSN